MLKLYLKNHVTLQIFFFIVIFNNITVFTVVVCFPLQINLKLLNSSDYAQFCGHNAIFQLLKVIVWCHWITSTSGVNAFQHAAEQQSFSRKTVLTESVTDSSMCSALVIISSIFMRALWAAGHPVFGVLC